MAIADDMRKEVKEILQTEWSRREGRVVPEPEDVKLGNDAVCLDGTVLYADLAESTHLVNEYEDSFAAEVYKSYLVCACRLIRHNGGVITAFDGDRVMAVFIGDSKNTSAACCALNINHTVIKIINPAIEEEYPKLGFKLKQAVGIDTSKLFVARTGIRGSNDLVWVGRAANYAAKLCSLREKYYFSFITEDVYKVMNDSVKYGGEKKECMWEQTTWGEYGITIYRSSWWRSPS